MFRLSWVWASALFAAGWLLARGGEPGTLVTGFIVLALATWYCWRLRTGWWVLICIACGPIVAGRSELYQLNPYLANETVRPVLAWVQPMLAPVVIIATALFALRFFLDREGRTELWTEKRPRIALWLGIVSVALFAWRPMMGWLVLFAACGAMLAVPGYSIFTKRVRMTGRVALCAIAVEFLFSLSLSA